MFQTSVLEKKIHCNHQNKKHNTKHSFATKHPFETLCQTGNKFAEWLVVNIVNNLVWLLNESLNLLFAKYCWSFGKEVKGKENHHLALDHKT